MWFTSFLSDIVHGIYGDLVEIKLPLVLNILNYFNLLIIDTFFLTLKMYTSIESYYELSVTNKPFDTANISYN